MLHFLAIPLLVYWILGMYERSVWDAQEKLARSFMQRVQGEIALHQMATKDGLQIQRTVDNLFSSHSFQSLAVFDSDGRRVAFKGEKPPEGGDLSNITRVEVGPDKDVLRVTHWVRNEAPCQPCHALEKSYIGVIEGSLPLSSSISILGFSRHQIFLATAVAALFIFLVVTLFNYYFMTRPVQMIMDGMRRVKEGDLSVQVVLRRKDEMGRMAENFNEVVQSLREARRLLEERHQEGMTHAERLAAAGEIASGLAHEVKNPLAGISSALEVILSDPEPAPGHRDVLRQIHQEVRRVSGIINQLLDYVRPRQGRPDWVDLSLLISDLKSIFATQCRRKKVAFAVDSGEAAGRVFLDPDTLKQILLNMLQNALQAVKPGGQIALDIRPEPDRVRLVVRDDGEGMDETTRERIFHPFFTTKPGGTGLGLAIVARQIREMDGTIEVESAPGKGAAFTLTLPRKGTNENSHRG
jgi:hypothetical protein